MMTGRSSFISPMGSVPRPTPTHKVERAASCSPGACYPTMVRTQTARYIRRRGARWSPKAQPSLLRRPTGRGESGGIRASRRRHRARRLRIDVLTPSVFCRRWVCLSPTRRAAGPRAVRTRRLRPRRAPCVAKRGRGLHSMSKSVPERLYRSGFPCPGGAEGSRTPDLLIANEALYQLSYGPRIRSAGAPQARPRGADMCRFSPALSSVDAGAARRLERSGERVHTRRVWRLRCRSSPPCCSSSTA